MSLRSSLSQTGKDIKLTLAPKSNNALSMTCLTSTHGIENLPGSFCFLANLLSAIALHSKGLGSSNLRLFVKMSFRNLVYDGIWVMAPVKGISTGSFSITFTNFLYWVSCLVCLSLYGYGIGGM